MPGYPFISYYSISETDNITDIAMTVDDTADLVLITKATTQEKKNLIDFYKNNAGYIYVTNVTEFQTPSWSWYWTYIEQNFNIITDNINAILSSK